MKSETSKTPTADDVRKAVHTMIECSLAIRDSIRDLGQVPNGHLYANVIHVLSLDQYSMIIQHLKDAGLVEEQCHMLKWVGATPKASADGATTSTI